MTASDLPPDDSPGMRPLRHFPIVRTLTVVLLFVYALSAFVPWKPFFPDNELDSSWLLALHWARLHRLDFGHEFVLTYGPWGFILRGYHPQTFGLVVLGWSFYSIVFFAALVQLSKRLTTKPWLVALWIAIVIALAGVSLQGLEDLRIFLICWTFLLVHFYCDDRAASPLKIAMAIAMALASLGKFSISFMALAALGVTAIDLVLRRKIPWALLIYLVAIPIWWLAAGQRILSFGAYFRHSWHISTTYGQGEGLFAPTEARDVAMFLVGAVLLHVAAAMGDWRNRRRLLLTQVGLASSLFLLFKVGYVRHDPHEVIATIGLTAFSILYGAALWPVLCSTAHRIVLGMTAVAALAVACFSVARCSPDGLPMLVAETIGEFPSRASSAGHWMIGKSDAVKTYQALLDQYRESRPIPVVHGSVDAYSWTQRAIFANGLEYRPRPVVQGYLAYSTELGRINADFLRGPRAPDNILFEVQSIDGHLPSEEDALSWPELLTRYDPIDASQSLLLLTRAPTPRDYHFVPIEQRSVPLTQWIDVPPSTDPIWASIDIHSTLTGKIIELLYKPTPLTMQLKLRNGLRGEFRLLPAATSGGFLLSPVVNDRTSFALLNSKSWASELADSMVSQMRIVADTSSGLSDLYTSAYQITFSSLTFPHSDLSWVPGVAEYLGFRTFLTHLHVVHADFGIKLEYSDSGQAMLLTPGKTGVVFPATSGAHGMTLSFGIVNRSGDASQKIGAAEFRALAVTRDAQDHPTTRLLWSRKLDPDNNASDRGTQAAQISFTGPAPPQILLETIQDAPSPISSPYWSGVALR